MTPRDAAPPPDEASRRQAEAADPGGSTWLAANAGSGKTRVLTDRVARLLLRGVSPQSVLCLTYTRAAAGEMQNRLFARLGEWAMLPDDKLRDALRGLGEAGALEAGTLAAARRLFARAIETPGGLKIQTIHAFCAGLLRRFPLEAGVSPRFSELDERSARLLQEDVLERLAERHPEDLDALAAHLGGRDLAEILTEIARHRGALSTPMDRDGALAAFGLPAGFDAAALLAEVFLGDEADLRDALVPVLSAGKKTDEDAAARLRALSLAPPTLDDLAALEALLLYGETAKAPFAAKIGSFPTKETRARLGNRIGPLEDLMARVEAARPRRLGLAAAERMAAVHRFAARFLPAVEAAKAARGLLDFDDQIDRASQLLSDPGVAQWVLYKLDGGIDHILVDEAQDTSPAQWAVIARLAEEMMAGGDAADRPAGRSLFVVGDAKQSIYSFQGADLRVFEAMRQAFADRLADAQAGLRQLALEHSFRSSPAILRAVDAVFAGEGARGLGGPVTHIPFFPDFPGRVDLWPALPRAEAVEPPAWHDPVDRLPEEHAEVRLARMIAAEIARLLRDRVPVPFAREPSRPIRPGDILILVRRRSTLFQQIIAACKAAGLPIAGADRMDLGSELAVKDLVALLSFLATPEDDLSLAAVLRSPLGGWSEARLYRLAHGRPGFLWEALRGRADCADTRDWLMDLRDVADFLRPYELLERALTRHGGRARLLGRLGAEAEEGIDALLVQALAYERTEVPSLTGFLGWLGAEEVEVKRRADAGDDRIRVMTVHGAKGLEAPVVILPETAARQPPRGPLLMPLAEDRVAWAGAQAEAPPTLAAVLARRSEAQAEEDARLLYVAMTRAESWLIVAAAEGRGAGEGWHDRIAAALRAAGAEPTAFPTGTGLRLSHGAWPEAAEAPAGQTPAGPALPDWVHRAAPPCAGPPAPLSPSDLGGAKALPGEAPVFDEAAALRRGRLLHRLLEHLPGTPPELWPARAAELLATGPDTAEPAEGAALLAEAQTVLEAPDLAFLFGGGALAEVEIAAELGGRPLLGTIDRLVIEPHRVRAVDWKSNAVVPARAEETPEGLLRQMAAYAHALGQVYPGRSVEAALLFTRGPRLIWLPPALMAAALARACAEAGIDPPRAAP